MTGGRAESKYAGNKPREVRERVARHLSERDGPGDRAARTHRLRRLATD